MDQIQELDVIHEIQLDASHFNANFNLKPQAYQMLYCDLVEKHLNLYNLGTDRTIEHGVAWVILSLTVDIKKPLQKTGILHAKTWKSGLKGPYFMRDFIFEDSDGTVYFQGTSFNILMNLNTRRVCRDKKLPYFSLGSYDFHVTQGFPTWKAAYGEEFLPTKNSLHACILRKVENSFIDMLGHVNNMRYGEFIYDAMDNDQIRALSKLSRMEIYFGSELKADDTFTVAATEIGRVLYVCGENNAKTEPSFYAALRFDHP